MKEKGRERKRDGGRLDKRAVTGIWCMFGGREACYFCVWVEGSCAAVDDVEGFAYPRGGRSASRFHIWNPILGT